MDLALPHSNLPPIEAALNATAAALLSYGYVMIRRKRIFAHKCCMLSAFCASVGFLVVYLWFHAQYGDIHFEGRGAVRTFYLGMLATHIVLAAVIGPLALITLYLALSGRFFRHKRIARWTLPIWLYVSITGVAVYLMLYHLYPPR